MIDELYPIALDIGMSSSIFYESSIVEVVDMIDSYERREKRKQKQKAIDNQILADQIIRGFNIIMNGNGKNDAESNMKMLWEYYPDLFFEEEQLYYQNKERDEFENFKASRKKFANYYNKKFKGGGD